MPNSLPIAIPSLTSWLERFPELPVVKTISTQYSRFAQSKYAVDINVMYAEAMQYGKVDHLTQQILWIHVLVIGGLALLNSHFRLADMYPSPFGWKTITDLEGLGVIAVAIFAAWLPTFVYSRQTNHYLWRLLVAFSFTICSFLLIFTSGGATEMHFHIFLAMAYMAIYADWRIGWFMFAMVFLYHSSLELMAPSRLDFYGSNSLAVPLNTIFVLVMAIFTTILCRNYRQAIMELVDAKQRNDQFLAIASHELKTPLTSMKGYAEILQRRLKRSNDTGSLDYADKMSGQLSKITSLVKDLLDVSKLQAGQAEFRQDWFSAESLVTQAIEEVQAASHHHKVELEGNTRVMIQGDRERLSQVLVNLLTNAMKYSPNSDRVIVRVASSHDKVVFEVQDFGMGIPETDQPKIFEPYFRGRFSRREDVPGGLGMGLHICNEIIKRHHGKIWVDSIVDQGSTFSFLLPLNAGKGHYTYGQNSDS